MICRQQLAALFIGAKSQSALCRTSVHKVTLMLMILNTLLTYRLIFLLKMYIVNQKSCMNLKEYEELE